MHRAAKPSHLPPLNSLRAFEVAARHANFRKAAAELHVTPAAVSHQVKALEDHLGVQLFYRQPRALELTPAALACLPQLREGFGALAAAAELMRSGSRRATLFLEVAPAFAVKWLGRRIDRFVSAHPDIDLHLEAKPQRIDGRPGELEGNGDSRVPVRQNSVAILFGSGHYPGYRSERLFSVAVTPMCAPGLKAGGRPLRHPRDLRYHTLLHDEALNLHDGRSRWEAWLSAAGVDGVDIGRGPHFNHAALALEAAADGVGVVLSCPLLASADLAAGRLVAPFALAVPLEQAYYLVYQHAAAGRAGIAAFRAWLLKEVGTFTAG
jgi:LysR family glycine cleavage system transcriptional activator